MALEEMIKTGDEEGMIQTLHQALREPQYRCAPVRRVELPQPQGGTSPLGIATVKERVVQTAMPRILAPILEADLPDCSYGSRPQRAANQASQALRTDLYNRAWGGVESACQAYFTSIAPRKLRTLITQRSADGSLLKRSQQTRTVGTHSKGQVVSTKGGGPQGSPLAPLSRNIYLNLLAQLWQSRGSPAKLGALLHRYADEASLVGRRSPPPVLAAFEGIAKRMERTLNRAKTHVTRVSEGFDCRGFHGGKRNRPTSGKNTISMCPAQSAPQKMRNRRQYSTSRRAPSSPQACGERVKPVVMGWANYVRHANASQALRGLQRCVHIRCRRYLPQRRKGRGFGWPRFPHSTL
jgi:group II intron reverse transcriptase/maturase